MFYSLVFYSLLLTFRQRASIFADNGFRICFYWFFLDKSFNWRWVLHLRTKKLLQLCTEQDLFYIVIAIAIFFWGAKFTYCGGTYITLIRTTYRISEGAFVYIHKKQFSTKRMPVGNQIEHTIECDNLIKVIKTKKTMRRKGKCWI